MPGSRTHSPDPSGGGRAATVALDLEVADKARLPNALTGPCTRLHLPVSAVPPFIPKMSLAFPQPEKKTNSPEYREGQRE